MSKRVLVLYADDTGEPRQALIEDWKPDTELDHNKLPNYNDGCTVFLIPLWTCDDHRPDVCDIEGNELLCVFLNAAELA